VTGAALLPPAAARLAGLTGPLAVLRVEDFSHSVAYRTGCLTRELAPHGAVIVLDDAASRPLWRAIRDVAPLLGGIEAEQAV